MSILATVLTATEVLMRVMPHAVKTVQDVMPFAQSLYKQFKGEDLTADELTELQAEVDRRHVKFQEPLPPAQPGDPDYKEPPDIA